MAAGRRAQHIQYGFAILVSLCVWCAGAWMTWPSIAIKKLLNGEVCCNVTKSEVSTMVALMDFGNILSPIPASLLSDRFGRRVLIHSTAVMFILSSSLVMIADNIWYLYVARLLAGMGKGVTNAVIPVYLAEIAQVKIRGALGAIFSLSSNLGVCYDYTLGTFLSYEGVNLGNLVIPILLGLGMFFAPESPYYLVAKGRVSKAQKSLAVFRDMAADDERLLEEMAGMKATVQKDARTKGRFLDLAATPSRRRALLIALLASAGQKFSGVTPVLAFSTVTLPETGGGASREVYVMLMSYLMILSVTLGQRLIDSWGRRRLLLVSTFGTAAINAVFAVFYTVRAFNIDVSYFNWIPYVNLLLFGLFWPLGLLCVPTVLMGELFPTNIKSHASSIATICNAFVPFVLNKMFGEIALTYGVEIMFYIFTVCSIICGLGFCHFVFETKGKTFQEIQDHLKKITGE